MLFLPSYENLDLHRLQTVVERIHHGDRFHRGEGQTVARIYLMFGEVEVGDPDNRYLYVAENSLCAKWVSRDFLELIYRVFPEMKNSVDIKRHPEFYPDTVVLPNGQVYRFVSVDWIADWAEARLRGCRFSKVFFDVSADKQYELDRQNTELIDALEDLQSTGAELV